MADRPLVGLLEHQGADEADDSFVIREDADDVGTALDLLVHALERVRAGDLGPVLLGVVHVGEGVLARSGHQWDAWEFLQPCTLRERVVSSG